MLIGLNGDHRFLPSHTPEFHVADTARLTILAHNLIPVALHGPRKIVETRYGVNLDEGINNGFSDNRGNGRAADVMRRHKVRAQQSTKQFDFHLEALLPRWVMRLDPNLHDLATASPGRLTSELSGRQKRRGLCESKRRDAFDGPLQRRVRRHTWPNIY